MRTALVSDLHIGARAGQDVLRVPLARRRLFERLEPADRIVLLGDTIELREAPIGSVLQDALPFVTELTDALAGRELVIVPGNHDHTLAETWLERRRLDPDQPRLGNEQAFGPGGSGPAAWLARRMKGVELSLAYPGLWLREDVYATHGHYLDCHMTVPRLECISARVVERLAGSLPEGRLDPQDYEELLAPLYAFIYGLAQGGGPAKKGIDADLSSRVWGAMHADGTGRPLRARAVAGLLRRAVFPGAVAALNVAGLGPFRADLSAHELRRAGLRAMGEVTARLEIASARDGDPPYVLFGHTHRAWPLPGIDAGGRPPGSTARLVNCGSWILSRGLVASSGADSPYWPGTIVWVEDEGPPRLERALEDVPAAELLPA